MQPQTLSTVMANPQTWQASLLPFFITGFAFAAFLLDEVFAVAFLATVFFATFALGAVFLAAVLFNAILCSLLFSLPYRQLVNIIISNSDRKANRSQVEIYLEIGAWTKKQLMRISPA